jgi:hypothetical protein
MRQEIYHTTQECGSFQKRTKGRQAQDRGQWVRIACSEGFILGVLSHQPCRLPAARLYPSWCRQCWCVAARQETPLQRKGGF